MSVQTTNQNSLAHQDAEKMELIKRTICKGASNDEIELFLHACRRTELDPLMRQIYFVKMGNQMTIQTGIDGYRLIAERSKRYMPGKEATFVYDKAGKLFSATSYVKKLGPDNQWHEIAATAIFSEYVGKGPLWLSKPHVMLAKCSEALALRRAFPADLSGVYTKEEMEHHPQETLSIVQDKIDAPVEKERLIPHPEATQLEMSIHLHIAPVDPEYRERALKAIGNYNSFEDVPLSNLKRLQDNIAKKISQIKQGEPEIEF